MIKTFTFWIPEEQKKELRRRSYEEEKPIAEMIREAIGEYLKIQKREPGPCQDTSDGSR